MLKQLRNLDQRIVEQLLLLIEKTANSEIVITIENSHHLANYDLNEMITILELQLRNNESYLNLLPDEITLKHLKVKKTNPINYIPDNRFNGLKIARIEKDKDNHLIDRPNFITNSLELDMILASHGKKPNTHQRAKAIYDKKRILGMKYCATWLTDYRPYVLNEIKKDGFNSVYMSERLKSDFEIMTFSLLSRPWSAKVFPKEVLKNFQFNDEFLLESKEVFQYIHDIYVPSHDLLEKILFHHPYYCVYLRNHPIYNYFLIYAFMRLTSVFSYLTNKEKEFISFHALQWIHQLDKQSQKKLIKLTQIDYFIRDMKSKEHLAYLNLLIAFNKVIPHHLLPIIAESQVSDKMAVLDWNAQHTLDWFFGLISEEDTSIFQKVIHKIEVPKDLIRNIIEKSPQLTPRISMILLDIIHGR